MLSFSDVCARKWSSPWWHAWSPCPWELRWSISKVVKSPHFLVAIVVERRGWVLLLLGPSEIFSGVQSGGDDVGSGIVDVGFFEKRIFSGERPWCPTRTVSMMWRRKTNKIWKSMHYVHSRLLSWMITNKNILKSDKPKWSVQPKWDQGQFLHIHTPCPVL